MYSVYLNPCILYTWNLVFCILEPLYSLSTWTLVFIVYLNPCIHCIPEPLYSLSTWTLVFIVYLKKNPCIHCIPEPLYLLYTWTLVFIVTSLLFIVYLNPDLEFIVEFLEYPGGPVDSESLLQMKKFSVANHETV